MVSNLLALYASLAVLFLNIFHRTQVEAPVASHLDVILYSRDQINLENAAMQQPAETYVRASDGAVVAEDAAWGIISIKPQMEAFETPVCMRARARVLSASKNSFFECLFLSRLFRSHLAFSIFVC
jgi:hypothetical protein